MKTYIIQWRTSDAPQWKSGGEVRARSLAGAIAKVARLYSDIVCDSLEISACVKDC